MEKPMAWIIPLVTELEARRDEIRTSHLHWTEIIRKAAMNSWPMIKCSQGGLHDLTTTSPYMMLYTGKYIRITQHLSQFHIPCFYYAHIPIVSNYTLKPPRPFPVHFHGIQPDSFPKKHTFSPKKILEKAWTPQTAPGKFHTLRGVLEDHHLERANFARRTPMKVALACAAGHFLYASGWIFEVIPGKSAACHLSLVVFHAFMVLSWWFDGFCRWFLPPDLNPAIAVAKCDCSHSNSPCCQCKKKKTHPK